MYIQQRNKGLRHTLYIFFIKYTYICMFQPFVLGGLDGHEIYFYFGFKMFHESTILYFVKIEFFFSSQIKKHVTEFTCMCLFALQSHYQLDFLTYFYNIKSITLTLQQSGIKSSHQIYIFWFRKNPCHSPLTMPTPVYNKATEHR